MLRSLDKKWEAIISFSLSIEEGGSVSKNWDIVRKEIGKYEPKKFLLKFDREILDLDCGIIFLSEISANGFQIIIDLTNSKDIERDYQKVLDNNIWAISVNQSFDIENFNYGILRFYTISLSCIDKKTEEYDDEDDDEDDDQGWLTLGDFFKSLE